MALAVARATSAAVRRFFNTNAMSEAHMTLRSRERRKVLAFDADFSPSLPMRNTMQRIIGALTAAMLVSSGGTSNAAATGYAPMDVAALLTAAHGAPPMICALAARSVRNYGWGNSGEAPSTPLGAAAMVINRDNGDTQLPQADVDRLFTALASDDACVRELSVRMLGNQRADAVASAFVTRLASPDAAMREVAAFGLGMTQPKTAIDPLIGALRDATPGVRANSAWALGRIDHGRALQPLVGLFRDNSEMVREASVLAAGRIDSASSIPALLRVLQNDESPRVRRVAAWALGQRGAREATDALGGALSKESDPRVREMIAWALGNSRGKSGAEALGTALRRDSDDDVRETAAWALAETGDRTAVDALGNAIENDKSSRVRGTAAWAIGQLAGHGTKAPAGLLRALKDENDDTRLRAAWALGQLGDAGMTSEINNALKAEKSDQVRKALIRALIKSGGRSEETLTELLKSSDATVRESAVRGLVGSNSFNPWPWPQPRPRPFP